MFVFFSIEFALKIVKNARMVPGRGPMCLACRAEFIDLGVRIFARGVRFFLNGHSVIEKSMFTNRSNRWH